MASVIESCRIALSHIRAKDIASLTESSVEAKQCSLHYAAVRDMVLRDTDWPMARKTVALALLSVEPLRWVYAYQYPTDALAVRMITGDWAFKDSTAEGLAVRFRTQEEILEPEPGVPFGIENIDGNKVIVTDQPEAYAVYTKQITDFNVWDQTMRTAFEWLLASRLAIPLIGGEFGKGMRADALSMYQATLASAISAAENEQKRQPRREASLVNARF